MRPLWQGVPDAVREAHTAVERARQPAKRADRVEVLRQERAFERTRQQVVRAFLARANECDPDEIEDDDLYNVVIEDPQLSERGDALAEEYRALAQRARTAYPTEPALRPRRPQIAQFANWLARLFGTAPRDRAIVSIEQVQGRLARLWNPFERTAHLTVFGMNGTGKTHLVRHGIRPVRGERTVVLDVKGDAGVNPWSGWGTTVDELPACWEGRVRLILTGTTDDAKRRARAALELLLLEGFAVVVADDKRALTDRERFGCSSLIEALATEGRGRGVMLVMGAQSVAYATPLLKDQAGAIFVGAMTSRVQVKDLADLTGYGRELVPTLASVPSRRFLYTDRWEDAPVACITGV